MVPFGWYLQVPSDHGNAQTQEDHPSGRTYGRHHRCRIRHRASPRDQALIVWLSGSDRRHRRSGTSGKPKPKCPAALPRRLDVSDRGDQLAFAAEVADWAPAPIGAVFNNAGVALSTKASGASVEDEELLAPSSNPPGVVNGVGRPPPAAAASPG